MLYFEAINDVVFMQRNINAQQLLFNPPIKELVKSDHPYVKISELVNFEKLTRSIRISISNGAVAKSGGRGR